jgi:hypothetical protein
MRRFGITFDLRDPRRPDTVEQAAKYVRTWAAFVGVDVPEDAEPSVEYLDGPSGGSALSVTGRVPVAFRPALIQAVL